MLSHCIAAENRKLRGSPIWVVFSAAGAVGGVRNLQFSAKSESFTLYCLVFLAVFLLAADCLLRKQDVKA